jgi:hypothetical protein
MLGSNVNFGEKIWGLGKRRWYKSRANFFAESLYRHSRQLARRASERGTRASQQGTSSRRKPVPVTGHRLTGVERMLTVAVMSRMAAVGRAISAAVWPI